MGVLKEMKRMKFVDNIGDVYSIRKNRAGGWVMTCMSASDGRTEDVRWNAQPFHSRTEAAMWIRSYANTFHWKELRDG